MDTVSETVTITLPTFHPEQARCFHTSATWDLIALRAGRRWGKNVYGETTASDHIARGMTVGWFAPEYKRLTETYENIAQMVEPVKTRSKQGEVIRTLTDGRIDFWSLDDENAGRGRKYHLIVIDEAAFGKKKQLLETWERSIKPTLVDYAGRALVMSNTNGIDPDDFFYTICHEPRLGFRQFHAPTRSNPFLPLKRPTESFDQWVERRRAYFDKLRADTPPLVYEQEYKAEFVDWSGASFFALNEMLVKGDDGIYAPVDLPVRCDAVYAIVDTATKTGRANDGTAVTYFALIKHGLSYQLVILDWDIQQIEGALLETWLPTIFQNLEHFAKACRARSGSVGAFIEDKSSGMVLLQQAARRGWPATAIDSKLTSLGKDERAISISGYVYRGLVKLSRKAFDKVTTYKGTTRNHFRGQVVGFRIGSKNEQREDDLLDTFCYGTALGLGNNEGF